MSTEEIRIMFCNELSEMMKDNNVKKFTWDCMLMYCLAMSYINGDYPEYVKTIWGVGKMVKK